tara:strand:- start:1062 stop:1580 length:519 start_codon:yes stop_codon:yes gene_type:complete
MTKRKTSCFTIHLLIIFLLIGILILFCSNKKNILEANTNMNEENEITEDCNENICEEKKDNWEKNNSNYTYSCENAINDCKEKKIDQWKKCKRKCIKKKYHKSIENLVEKKSGAETTISKVFGPLAEKFREEYEKIINMFEEGDKQYINDCDKDAEFENCMNPESDDESNDD